VEQLAFPELVPFLMLIESTLKVGSVLAPSNSLGRSVACDALGSNASPAIDARVASGVEELDAAMADLDRLLASPAG
jgi:hypothetical protein